MTRMFCNTRQRDEILTEFSIVEVIATIFVEFYKMYVSFKCANESMKFK